MLSHGALRMEQTTDSLHILGLETLPHLVQSPHRKMGADITSSQGHWKDSRR